jgi:hypothetical protein
LSEKTLEHQNGFISGHSDVWRGLLDIVQPFDAHPPKFVAPLGFAKPSVQGFVLQSMPSRQFYASYSCYNTSRHFLNRSELSLDLLERKTSNDEEGQSKNQHQKDSSSKSAISAASE